MGAHLLISRRPFLSSPGTYFVSFYSEEESFGVNLFSVKGITKENAKILTLWLNSSFSIVQMLYQGAARDGNWTKLDQYMINEIMVPDIQRLNQKDKDLLIEFFNEWKSKEIKSIYDQYKYGDEFRDKLDLIFFDILQERNNVQK
ncbi:MAG TPA: hypothetical protein VKU94_02625 [Geobacterales bacterium]|nr:hypothetical protein [Geobacterales bacterium]